MRTETHDRREPSNHLGSPPQRVASMVTVDSCKQFLASQDSAPEVHHEVRVRLAKEYHNKPRSPPVLLSKKRRQDKTREKTRQDQYTGYENPQGL